MWNDAKPHVHDAQNLSGTIVGTLVAILINIPAKDLAYTAAMAAVGACTSFLASCLLKWLTRRIEQWIRQNKTPPA
ncbi:MAG: hypothetical protein LCH58_15990 [Bacteroidetes bacterium]|uniref:Uncharacterized protein n=2 Tax=Chitinophagaceae TaxID=563835 RepID=A0A6I6GDA5_9BACT|nr:hypothetical protein [Bacteroidota bacterium]QGW28290.1 hypothetical protein GLV81_09440 [Phnomibacter ginsenosidimutans]